MYSQSPNSLYYDLENSKSWLSGNFVVVVIIIIIIILFQMSSFYDWRLVKEFKPSCNFLSEKNCTVCILKYGKNRNWEMKLFQLFHL